jgi:hypothetical protein
MTDGEYAFKGTLRFGLIDVTEAQMGIILVHVISGAFGCEFWTQSVCRTLCLNEVFYQYVLIPYSVLFFVLYIYT